MQRDTPEAEAPALARLGELIAPESDEGSSLDAFLHWVSERGLEPYPAQEEAVLALWEGRHVVLQTPTGSGKSLVAQALHLKARCEGRRSFYTAPIKALVSEKFFALCEEFGAADVGMLTGDATVNPGAPIICCTAEVLSNMSLRQGDACDAPYVVMDEFHFYGDPARGVAWQIPLLTLPKTTFLLMSATLGNTAAIEERLEQATGRAVTHVYSVDRPVPLDFDYSETSIHETVEGLLQDGRAPVYVVHFTQRQAAEQAQALTSVRVCDSETKKKIVETIGQFRFDSPYGKEIHRILRHGVGLHHAGLLPKYRLLVERLAQRGLLRVVCGTDTLGVGVNIPIRTVLFSALAKYDGEKVGILRVREFKQIAGRAGRRGFDEAGSVVCQAPEHVIETKRREKRSRDGKGRKEKKGGKRGRAPKPRGGVNWNRETFERLIHQPPETLESHFRVTHGMLVDCLHSGSGDLGERSGSGRGYQRLVELINASHERPARQRALRREAATVFRSLREAGVIEVLAAAPGQTPRVQIHDDLQFEFSLHHALSLFLVDAVFLLDPEDDDYALDVLSLVEAILENPRALLLRQLDAKKKMLIAELKAQRVPFEERIERLDEVEIDKPNAAFIYESFKLFSERHPWAPASAIRPKSIAREMWERYEDFSDYVKRYGLMRSEGLLLRYLHQVHNVLVQSLPESARNEELVDAIAFFRAMVSRVDSSLIDEWERLVSPGAETEAPSEAGRRGGPAFDEKAFQARLRAEMHQVVRALSVGDYDAVCASLAEDSDDVWDPARIRDALAPFFAEYESIVFGAEARRAYQTQIESRGGGHYWVRHTLLDDRGDHFWRVEAEILPVSGEREPGEPLLHLRAISD